MKYRFKAFFLVSLALSGCVSDNDVDSDKCSSFGFHPGSRSFNNCLIVQNSSSADNELRFLDIIHAEEERERQSSIVKNRRE